MKKVKLFIGIILFFGISFHGTKTSEMIEFTKNETNVNLMDSRLDNFYFPAFEKTDFEAFSNCSASCGNKSCSGSGSCTCSCDWFSCNCKSNPPQGIVEIYLTKEDYLIHKEFAKLLYDSNEDEGIKASQIIANWVTDFFETKGLTFISIPHLI